MRYVTTRKDQETYPARKALEEDRGPDGGLFLPALTPNFSLEELEKLWEKPFTARIAQVLNGFFDTAITQWDVDFCVGRHPVELVGLPQKILVAQCWHNWEGELAYLVRVLASRLRPDAEPVPTDWLEVAVRIALLLAILGQVRETVGFSQGQKVDISLLSGEFYGPISAWYARLWGAPIGSIVCCCNENNQIWELLHRGQLHTDAVAVQTAMPLADVAVPAGLERLVFATGGARETGRYQQILRQGGVYAPGEECLAAMARGMAVSVVGKQRMEATMRSVYACGTLLGPYDGLCHAGLLDHRTHTGGRAWALIFSERAPRRDWAAVEAAFAGYSAIFESLEEPK